MELFNSNAYALNTSSIPVSFLVTFTAALSQTTSCGSGIVGFQTTLSNQFSVNVSLTNFITTSVRVAAMVFDDTLVSYLSVNYIAVGAKTYFLEVQFSCKQDDMLRLPADCFIGWQWHKDRDQDQYNPIHQSGVVMQPVFFRISGGQQSRPDKLPQRSSDLQQRNRYLPYLHNLLKQQNQPNLLHHSNLLRCMHQSNDQLLRMGPTRIRFPG